MVRFDFSCSFITKSFGVENLLSLGAFFIIVYIWENGKGIESRRISNVRSFPKLSLEAIGKLLALIQFPWVCPSLPKQKWVRLNRASKDESLDISLLQFFSPLISWVC